MITAKYHKILLLAQSIWNYYRDKNTFLRISLKSCSFFNCGNVLITDIWSFHWFTVFSLSVRRNLNKSGRSRLDEHSCPTSSITHPSSPLPSLASRLIFWPWIRPSVCLHLNDFLRSEVNVPSLTKRWLISRLGQSPRMVICLKESQCVWKCPSFLS